MSCAGAVFCAFERLRGQNGHRFTQFEMITLLDATISQFSKDGFVFIQMSITTGQESFKLFEKPPGSTAYGHLVVDSDNIA